MSKLRFTLPNYVRPILNSQTFSKLRFCFFILLAAQFCRFNLFNNVVNFEVVIEKVVQNIFKDYLWDTFIERDVYKNVVDEYGRCGPNSYGSEECRQHEKKSGGCLEIHLRWAKFRKHIM